MLQRAVGVLAIVGAVASLCFALTLKAEPPNLLLPDSVDIDPASVESVAMADVRVENPCSYAIEILELIPSCSCTEVNSPQMIWQPGDTGSMQVSVELDDRPASPTLTVVFHGVHSSVVARRTVKLRVRGPDSPSHAE